MRKQIEAWEGRLVKSDSMYYDGLAIDTDTLDEIMDSIKSYEGKKIRIIVEVID